MELPLHCILLNKIFLKHDIRFDLAKRRAVREDFHVPFADTNEEDFRVETAAVVAADNVIVRDRIRRGEKDAPGYVDMRNCGICVKAAKISGRVEVTK